MNPVELRHYFAFSSQLSIASRSQDAGAAQEAVDELEAIAMHSDHAGLRCRAAAAVASHQARLTQRGDTVLT